MKNYLIVKLKNGKEFIIIDKIQHNKKTYFLLLKSLKLKDNGEDNFEVLEYNEDTNSLEYIKNIEEYDFIYSTFNSRLEKQADIILMLEKLHKLKIIAINKYNYTLEDQNGFRVVKNINFEINNKPKVNDYIYMSKKIINEKNLFEYGYIYNLSRLTENEIIKLESQNDELFLQRYYG